MSDKRLTPDGQGGFHILGGDGGRAVPDGQGGFHILSGGGGGLSAGEGLLMAILMPIVLIAMAVITPPAISYFILFGIIAGVTQMLLGRPLTPLEYSAVGTQGLVITIIFWVLIGILYLMRRRKK